MCIMYIAYYKTSYFNIHYPSTYNQQTIYAAYYDVTPKPEVIKKENPRFYNINLPTRLAENKDAYKKQGIVQIIDNKNPEIIILGDSHGVVWVNTLLDAIKELEVSSSVYTTNGSKPFINIKNLDDQIGNSFFTKQERIDFAKSIVKNIDTWKVKLVIMSCRWENLSPENKVEFESLIAYLRNRNIKLLAINQPPLLSFMGNNNASQFISYLKINPVKGYNTILVNEDEIIKSNSYLNELSNKHQNMIVFDVFNKLYTNGKAKISYNNDLLYFDDDHLSTKGTELFKQDLKNVLNGLMK